jgi:hypothetical protein
MLRLTRVIVRLSLEPVNVTDNYAYFGIPKCLQCLQGSYMWTLSECTAVMGRVFNIDVSSLGFSVFPAPFSISRCSCFCWLSCCVPRVQVIVCFCASLFLRDVSRTWSLDYLRPELLQWSYRFCSFVLFSEGSRVSFPFANLCCVCGFVLLIVVVPFMSVQVILSLHPYSRKRSCVQLRGYLSWLAKQSYGTFRAIGGNIERSGIEIGDSLEKRQ